MRLYFNAPQLLKCYAYATPPCLDRGTALAMASYTTSVVHHDDFVVRASLYNAKLMVHAWREAKKLMDDDEFEAREALDASILVRDGLEASRKGTKSRLGEGSLDRTPTSWSSCTAISMM